jgi:SNF2 family DNA or RNA helicase
MNQYIPQKVDKWINTDDFSRRYNSICYKISKDVLDLPECQHVRREVSLTGQGLRLYKQMKSEMLADIKTQIVDDAGNITGESVKQAVASNGAVRYLRLLQLAQGYVKTEESEIVSTDSCKKKILLELLEQTTEPVVVYGFFNPDLQCIKDCAALLGKKYGEVSGSRKDLTADSKYPDDVDVLGVQCLSGGTGIDLTKSRIGIIMNTGLLSPGNYDQMLARQYRPGQDKDVVFYHVVAKGTIDEDVQYARDRKRDIIEAIANGVAAGSDNEFLQSMAISDATGMFSATQQMDDFF